MKIRDTRCGNVLRTQNTNAHGPPQQPGPAVQRLQHLRQRASPSGVTRRRTINGISLNDVTDITGGTVQTFYLEGSGSSTGTCP